jgi:hypothetical protein
VVFVRPVLAVCLFALIPSIVHAQSVADSARQATFPLTSAERWHDYVHDEVGPFALAGTAVGAGIGTLNHSPGWWERSPEGYGYRLGAAFAAHTADVSVRDGLAAVMHQNLHYIPCGCHNVFARAGHAVISSVLGVNDQGERVFALPTVVGGYAGGLTTAALYQHEYGIAGGLRLGTASLAGHALGNLAKEFIVPLFVGHH